MTDHRLLLVRRTPGEQRAYRQGFEAGRAWKHDSDPFAVPVGGGEPQPTTSTHNECKRCPTCANAGWVGSRSNPDDCPTCGRKPYWTVGDGTYPSPLPVRSAGGGDQPDTPCPEAQP